MAKSVGIGLYLSAANFLKTKQIGLGLATSIENAVREHVEKFGKSHTLLQPFPFIKRRFFNTAVCRVMAVIFSPPLPR